MDNIKLYNLPTPDDGVVKVERLFCEIIKKYRDGEKLEPEVIDWMDNANTWLQSL